MPRKTYKRKKSRYEAWYVSANGTISIKMRSKWEVAYAQYLDRNTIAWAYEPRYFAIGKNKKYLPDFYLTTTKEYVEVKGRLTQRSKSKITAFCKQYPEIPYSVLRKEDLQKIGVVNSKGCAVLEVQMNNKKAAGTALGGKKMGSTL